MVSPWKKDCFFEKKILIFFEKTPKSSQFDAEFNRISKISGNVPNLRFFEDIDLFFEKNLDFFKIARSSKLALQGHGKK